jgi:hypothetical protein
LQSAQSWLAQSTAKPTFDVTSMFISPQMQYQANTDQFNRQFAVNKINAAPDPVGAAFSGAIVKLASTAIGAALGGGLGGVATALAPAAGSLMTPTAAPAGSVTLGSSMRAPTAGFGNLYG